MKPRVKLAEAVTSDGNTLALYEHDGAFAIHLGGQVLMHSRVNASEKLLGELGVARLKAGLSSRVLIGGLGLGFTLRTVLEAVGPETTVEVVELIPEVIDWNRTFLGRLNGVLLEDPRVEIRAEDVVGRIRKGTDPGYDVILLDVDNGPVAMVAKGNASLYSDGGVRLLRQALRPGGRVVLWSAGSDQAFAARLTKAGFDVRAVPAKTHEGAKSAAHRLYVADLKEKETPAPGAMVRPGTGGEDQTNFQSPR